MRCTNQNLALVRSLRLFILVLLYANMHESPHKKVNNIIDVMWFCVVLRDELPCYFSFLDSSLL